MIGPILASRVQPTHNLPPRHEIMGWCSLIRMLDSGLVSLEVSLVFMPSIASPKFEKVLADGLGLLCCYSHWSRHIPHIFHVHGFQGADKDPEHLALTEYLDQAVFQ